MYSRILQGLGLPLARASTQAAAVDLLEARPKAAPSNVDPRVVTTRVIRRSVSERVARDLDASHVFSSTL
jgi:hypothetical protein